MIIAVINESSALWFIPAEIKWNEDISSDRCFVGRYT